MKKNFVLGTLSLAVLSSALLTACGKKGGDEYLGTWEDKDRHSTTMVVERNGEGFLINMANKQASADGQKKSGAVPATLKDGVLNYPNGPITGTITYVKADDSVLVSTVGGTFAFVRAK